LNCCAEKPSEDIKSLNIEWDEANNSDITQILALAVGGPQQASHAEGLAVQGEDHS